MIKRHPLTAFFVLACLISWALWAPLWLPALGITGLPALPFHHALGAFGPLAAAFLVTVRETGRSGTGDLLRRMVLWRGVWVAIGGLAPFALLGLALLGAWLVADTPLAPPGIGLSREFPQWSAPGVLLYHLMTFGYGEEVGWRGFALPRLQAHRSAFRATLLLTAGWALWHAPLFLYRPGYTEMGGSAIAGWLLSLVTGAILLTWLYNSSRGSLLVVALLHASIDVVFTSTLASETVVNATGALVTIWGLAVLVGTGPTYLSRVGKVISTTESPGQTLVPSSAENAR